MGHSKSSAMADIKDRDAVSAPIALIDLKAQQNVIRTEIDRAIARVLDHGQYIMGPEIGIFEDALAAYSDVRHAVSCANGTDALLMILMAKGVGPGDAIICPGFTFTATPEVIALIGATPVFADVREDTFNLDPDRLEDAVTAARARGLKPVGIMAVDLFGLPADYDRITTFAEREGMWFLSDAAQSFGAQYANQRVGAYGVATATSFFPAKPLGCYGDGGAILTNDDEMADTLRSIRVHGKGSDKYDNVRIGMNGRLDTLQAAILIEKLKIFPAEVEARQRVAERYTAGLAGVVTCPGVPDGYRSVWAQYTIRVAADRRDNLRERLQAAGVPTAIYYPKSLNQQTAYAAFPSAEGGIPVSERLPLEVLSLPMHPYLDEPSQDRVIAEVVAALG